MCDKTIETPQGVIEGGIVVEKAPRKLVLRVWVSVALITPLIWVLWPHIGMLLQQ